MNGLAIQHHVALPASDWTLIQGTYTSRIRIRAHIAWDWGMGANPSAMMKLASIYVCNDALVPKCVSSLTHSGHESILFRFTKVWSGDAAS